MTAPIEHDYAEAAALLGVSEDWLRHNAPKNLPHRKKSLKANGRGRVVFTDAHLEEIRAMWDRRPAEPQAAKPLTRRRAS
jgi:hypothetical protein